MIGRARHRGVATAEVDAEMAAFEREMAELQAQKDARRADLARELRRSPAVRGMLYGRPGMIIVSGELSDLAGGKLRATMFGADGPQGHITKPTEEDVIERLTDGAFDPPYKAMSDDDVMAWQATPEFEVGTRRIAFVQGENTLRWFASKAGRGEWASKMIDRANEVGTRDYTVNTRGKPDDLDAFDEGLEVLHKAIRELPVPNPGRVRAYVRNPAWVTGVLARGYDFMGAQVKAEWLPVVAPVALKRDKVVAKFTEFGCGAYGCVLPTRDPRVVLKVTSDESEADFAAHVANELVRPICVHYHLVVRVAAKHEGRQVHLLWRESAEHVGKLREELGDQAVELINKQHRAGQVAFLAVHQGKPEKVQARAIIAWLESCEEMANKVPDLRELGRGIVEVYEQQRIVFGDLHPGNLGLVVRPNGAAWVITDPGNIVEVDLDLLERNPGGDVIKLMFSSPDARRAYKDALRVRLSAAGHAPHEATRMFDVWFAQRVYAEIDDHPPGVVHLAREVAQGMRGVMVKRRAD